MKKLVSFVICILCALIMVATFLLSWEWGNRKNSQWLSQIREIEELENQLAEIPTGFVNGFGESDTIYTSTKRVSADTTLMDQLWTSAFAWNSPEEYANQRASIISTYNLNTDTQFFREGMKDPATITDGSNPTFEGLSDMKYLKQDVQLVLRKMFIATLCVLVITQQIIAQKHHIVSVISYVILMLINKLPTQNIILLKAGNKLVQSILFKGRFFYD